MSKEMSKEKKTTINDLAEKVDAVLDGILSGDIDLPVASEFLNGVGKRLGIEKVKLAAKAIQLACNVRGVPMEDMPYLGIEGQKCLPK